jgi:hypothetical protein
MADLVAGVDHSTDEVQRPMVGSLESPLQLLPEYEAATSPGFLPGIRYIGARYSSMRRIRGDGNCFYRAFLFAFLESLLKDLTTGDETTKAKAEKERLRLLAVLTRSKDELVEIGYSEIAIESFHDVRTRSMLTGTPVHLKDARRLTGCWHCVVCSDMNLFPSTTTHRHHCRSWWSS